MMTQNRVSTTRGILAYAPAGSLLRFTGMATASRKGAMAARVTEAPTRSAHAGVSRTSHGYR